MSRTKEQLFTHACEKYELIFVNQIRARIYAARKEKENLQRNDYTQIFDKTLMFMLTCVDESLSEFKEMCEKKNYEDKNIEEYLHSRQIFYSHATIKCCCGAGIIRLKKTNPR